ncbi:MULTISPECIES: MarR family winged helix-turn-helix transcriptional regulator [Shewanella]|uniref:MarR family transcriptional regulator n=2 Tax=Shewanella TaxID=22 RepID=A0A974XII6_9GAMM|nr:MULTISPECIES: MarR family transcriptional regulator [Shewanella]QSX29047.1 MarR family transcriptional regulator [Shewanella cyperi]QSX36187.1 MarR family transcriptional regulator [Shewanella sedimentimangrovi]QSX39794.1 MarR family transcriptional regulator [Shewanella cyperi]
MTSHPRLLLDNQLCFALYSTSLAMTSLYKPLLEPLGLTYTQYLIMLILWEQDGMGLKDIAERLGQQSGALTPVIKRLENQGLVQRRRSDEDERSLAITLTDAGKAMEQQALEVNQCIISRCGMDIPELQALKQLLDNLRRKLGS